MNLRDRRSGDPGILLVCGRAIHDCVVELGIAMVMESWQRSGKKERRCSKCMPIILNFVAIFSYTTSMRGCLYH